MELHASQLAVKLLKPHTCEKKRGQLEDYGTCRHVGMTKRICKQERFKTHEGPQVFSGWSFYTHVGP